MRSAPRRLVLVLLTAAFAAGCGSSSKTDTTTNHTDTAAAPAGHYQAGDACQASLKKVYARQGLVCVNGTLQHKSVPPTVTHQGHTTTAGPQGY